MKVLSFILLLPLCCFATSHNNRIQISISPASVNLKTGARQQFTATVTGTNNTSISWQVSQGGGAISSTGSYTAPNSAGTAIVTATSQANPAKSVSAKITVTSSTQPYSVSLNWSDSTAGCTFNIYRSTISGGYYSELASGVSTPKYTDSNVTGGATYYYVVAAVLNGSTSGYSKQVQVSVP